LFELSYSVRKVSEDVKISCKIILKIFDVTRNIIVEELTKTDKVLGGKIEAESLFWRKK
jgi:hypothetical protein